MIHTSTEENIIKDSAAPEDTHTLLFIEPEENKDSQYRNPYKDVIALVRVVVSVCMMYISIEYITQMLFDLQKRDTMCYWNVLSLILGLYTTISIWNSCATDEEKKESASSKIIFILTSLILIIPGTVLGSPWLSFSISNFLVRAAEYPFVALIHLFIYLLADKYPSTNFNLLLKIFPSIIALIALIEYEIDLFHKKKAKVTRHELSVTSIAAISILAFFFLVISLNIFHLRDVKVSP